MTPPADGPPPLSPDLERRIDATWAVADARRRVCDALAAYGAAEHEREPDRVRLAILKLADGDAEEVASLVRAASRDYRDVLMWAEYPEEGRTLWMLRRDLTAEERAAVNAIRRRDREQYEAWLKTSEPAE
jgi:hypothetical protein